MEKELRDELKQFYAVIDSPNDDWYDPEINARIEEIKILLKKYARKPNVPSNKL